MHNQRFRQLAYSIGGKYGTQLRSRNCYVINDVAISLGRNEQFLTRFNSDGTQTRVEATEENLYNLLKV